MRMTCLCGRVYELDIEDGDVIAPFPIVCLCIVVMCIVYAHVCL